MLTGFVLGIYACVISRELRAWRTRRTDRRRPAPPPLPATPPPLSAVRLPADFHERNDGTNGAARMVRIDGVVFVSADDLVTILATQADSEDRDHRPRRGDLLRAMATAIGQASIDFELERGTP